MFIVILLINFLLQEDVEMFHRLIGMDIDHTGWNSWCFNLMGSAVRHMEIMMLWATFVYIILQLQQSKGKDS